MNSNVQVWLPPMLTLLGTLIAVVFAAWVNNRMMDASSRSLEARMEANSRALEAKIEALRAEMRQGFAEIRLEFHTALSALEHRLERVDERLQLVQK
jgi:CHASE1-domain containing sensor protein